MSTPILRLDTSYLRSDIDNSISSSLATPTSATRSRARSLSQSVIPSFLPLNSPRAETSPVDLPNIAVSHGANKARNESRKLLAHLLAQLQGRPLPPSSLYGPSLKSVLNDRGLGAVVQSVKETVKHKRRLSEGRIYDHPSRDESESEVEEEAVFNTDATFDLMTQLKDVLLISAQQKWDILNDRHRHNSGKEIESGKGSQNVRRRSRVHSRSLSATPLAPEGRATRTPPRLLSQCIQVLASVISEDCRFKISTPRPSRPPYALHAVTLDVAQFLIHNHRHDMVTLSQIAFAVIPAFYSFNPTLYNRLLGFFNDVLLGDILEGLDQAQHSQSGGLHSLSIDADDAKAPMVSITVDEVDDVPVGGQSVSDWPRWSKYNSTAINKTRSTHAPTQDVATHQRSSLVSPLLTAILDNVDFANPDSSWLPHLHRLLHRLVNYKPDAYLDILAVAAYHTPRARYHALKILSSYWPRAFGHLVVCKSFPEMSVPALPSRMRQSLEHKRRSLHHHRNPYAHQFIPWRFNIRSTLGSFEDVSQNNCRQCSRSIAEFGLFCPLCMCGVHFDCYDYPEGSSFSEYVVASGAERQRIALHKFCPVPPSKFASSPIVSLQGQHSFRWVNLFNMSICFMCRRPLWGYVMQALRCMSCKHFVHSSCLTEDLSQLPRCRSFSADDTFIAVNMQTLRASFMDHYRSLIFTEAEIGHQSYEDISIVHAILWVQSHILRFGVVLGSIIIVDSDEPTSPSQDASVPKFELHNLVSLYEKTLLSGKLKVSQAIGDYLAENNMQASMMSIFFDWSILTYIAASLKSPSGNATASVNLLTIDALDPFDDETASESTYSYETLSLAHIRDQLGDQFHVFSEAAARHVLSLLSDLGFFQRLDCERLLNDVREPEQIRCCFPLPVGLEVSNQVETLVSTIEACLLDLDLSVNEAGFMLLVRKMWPDRMMTDYALQRLCSAVVKWIISEDQNLGIMLRDYIAKGKSLPGVRSATEAQPWPSSVLSKTAKASSVNNGGDYVASRRALSIQYASRWMLAFHNLDVDNYADTVFTLLVRQTDTDETLDEYFLGKEVDDRRMRRQLASADKLLKLIIKLNQVSVLFTAFDDLFKRWLERANSLTPDSQSLSSLSRLFNREVETSHRLSSVIEPGVSISGTANFASGSALRILTDAATGSRVGFTDTMQSLCLFVCAGVDISIPTFMQFVSIAQQFEATLEECLLLIKATLWSAWLRSVGRQELQAVVAGLQQLLAPCISECLRTKKELDKNITFIRQSLAICLLVYGCERKYIMELDILRDEDIRGLPSRRKLHSRNSTISDPVIIDAKLMRALKMYVEAEIDEVSSLIAKFLNAFVNDAPFVESYEVDNFILRNMPTLCVCIWQFYGIQAPNLSIIRPALLLRVIVVDPHPFYKLLDDAISEQKQWELRLQAALRLFRIILDVTSPAFNVEGRQWKTSVIQIFDRFFSGIWMDEREEVRVALDTWARTLLEAHQNAIASCWNESLLKSPIAERVTLVSFLNQLRSHFPRWQVLSWNAITEALLENESPQKFDDDDVAAEHMAMYGLPSGNIENQEQKDLNGDCLRMSLLSLAMRMISDGIPIEPVHLVKVKFHLVKAIGYREVAMCPTITGRSFHIRFHSLPLIPKSADSCLNDFISVLDSSQAYDVSPSMMGGPYAEDEAPCSLLVGSILVDVLLDIFMNAEDLAALLPVTLKNLLKSLIIISYKHDFDRRPLKHLQGALRKAVRRALDLVLAEVSYEIRQLALSACHTLIKRWPAVVGNTLIEAIEISIRLLTVLDFEKNTDDVLVDQACSFLVTTLTMFATGGIFNALCKRPLTAEFFTVLRFISAPKVKGRRVSTRSSLNDTLLRDTLARSLENDSETFQLVIENLATFVEVVHHADYSSDMLQSVGIWLTGIARRTAEWPPGAFNTSPLFLLACTLIQHNKAYSRDILGFMETLLRATLIRCVVSTQSLTRVVDVTSELYRKAAVASGGQPTNPITLVMIEIVGDVVRGRARVAPATMVALCETMRAAVVPRLLKRKLIPVPEDLVYKLATDALLLLCNDTESQPQITFDVSQAAAALTLDVAEFQPSILSRLANSQVPTRTWNVLVIAALQSSHDVSASLIFDYFPAFSLAYSSCLEPYKDPQRLASLEAQNSAYIDISGAYASIKLWLLLVRKAANHHREARERLSEDREVNMLQDGEILATKTVWNELWPPLDRIMAALEAVAHAGGSSSSFIPEILPPGRTAIGTYVVRIRC
ncbi:uncharacterized protein FIBRA_04467 [Fibroporia radiculosa]|uniref:Phorbol-ester/DAG-type domain-containing protein n=1 Tax=Fibroporia radiculosa TaxID=599839 RepID=J4HWJ5_9APHY|nr:uncharacterized protein FIBRA_04467 [Fibroporia radiculosa]CCM02372.1 predicted protein [Fibroporia radiculosa]